MSDVPSIFPCWGRHSRMGHNVIVGLFQPFAGTSVFCTVPELPADPETFRLGSPATLGEVLPMDGPAFFGFKVLSEAEAMVSLLAGREVDYTAQHAAREMKRLTDTSTDADEVKDADEDCPTCGGHGTRDADGCPECGEILF